MEINQKTVEVLANTLKIDASKLTAELTAQGEPKVAELLSDKVIFTAPELETLKKNVDHEGYEKGKLAGKEMEVKAIKEKLGLKGQEGLKTYEDVLYHVVDVKTKDLKQAPDEAVKQLRAEKEALQKSIGEYDSKIKSLESTFENYKTNISITSKVDFATSNLTIDAEDNLANAQKEMLRDQFLKQHKIEVIDGKEYVINSNGQRLVNNLQEPITVMEAMKDFAPKYVRLKSISEGGRGGKSSTNTQLSGDLGGIKTKGEFELYIKNKNINIHSNEALALLKQVKTQNPDFK